MKTIDSTDGVIYSSKRRSGNTTRVADNVIQQLFNGYKVKLITENKQTHQHSSRLRSLILQRLRTEHYIIMDAIDLIEEPDGFFINLKYRDG